MPKLDPADGVVRISLVHYNTVEEVERIVGILRRVLTAPVFEPARSKL